MSGVQQEQLTRVRSATQALILKYLHKALRAGGTFHAQELRSYISNLGVPTAPASADRILRDMRQRGVVNYEIVNRRQSLYRVLKVGP